MQVQHRAAPVEFGEDWGDRPVLSRGRSCSSDLVLSPFVLVERGRWQSQPRPHLLQLRRPVSAVDHPSPHLAFSRRAPSQEHQPCEVRGPNGTHLRHDLDFRAARKNQRRLSPLARARSQASGNANRLAPSKLSCRRVRRPPGRMPGRAAPAPGKATLRCRRAVHPGRPRLGQGGVPTCWPGHRDLPSSSSSSGVCPSRWHRAMARAARLISALAFWSWR